MTITFFPPHPLLRAHVSQIWIVENATGWKPQDIKTIVPNGRMKIVFPYRSALLNRAALPSSPRAPFQRNPANTLWVLGMSDRPSIVDSEGPIGVLSAELYPGAAWPFFPPDLKELANLVTPAAQVLGAPAAELEARLAEEPTAQGKVDLLQDFLLGVLAQGRHEDEVVGHAVRFIQERGGLVTIGELTEKMGYSQRYLAMKFDRFVGLGPKTLAEIVRFQNRFVMLTRFGAAGGAAGSAAGSAPGFDDDYYDQSHFSRQFKRFSGLPPATYLKKTNEFLPMFYGGTAPWQRSSSASFRRARISDRR